MPGRASEKGVPSLLLRGSNTSTLRVRADSILRPFAPRTNAFFFAHACGGMAGVAEKCVPMNVIAEVAHTVIPECLSSSPRSVALSSSPRSVVVRGIKSLTAIFRTETLRDDGVWCGMTPLLLPRVWRVAGG